MVTRKEFISTVIRVNKKFSVDDFEILYTQKDDWDYEEYPIFIGIENGNLIVWDILADIKIQEKDPIKLVDEYFVSQAEQFVAIQSISKGLGEPEIALITNYGLRAEFKLTNNLQGLEFISVTQFLTPPPSKEEGVVSKLGNKIKKDAYVEINASLPYEVGVGASLNEARNFLSNFNTEIAIFKNFFGNIKNYTIGQWGGVGGVSKDKLKIPRGKFTGHKYVVENSVGRYPVFFYPFGAKLSGNGATFSSSSKNISTIPANDDEFLELLFNSGKDIKFLPPSLGTDIKETALMGNGIFFYLDVKEN